MELVLIKEPLIEEYTLVAIIALSSTNEIQFSTSSIAAGTNVIIPEGESWLFDLPNSPEYNYVEVYGTLVFSDALVSY